VTDPLAGHSRRGVAGLVRRAILTVRYRGWRVLAGRVASAPLRATPLGRYVGPARGSLGDWRAARRWYRANRRPVTVVIASYRDAPEVAQLVGSIRRTTRGAVPPIVVADDASGPDHLAALNAIAGIEVVAGDRNVGFAGNVNRGLAATDPAHDVVLLNSDMIARPGWLACLQHAALSHPDVGIVGARLLYPDGRIQFAGTQRNLGAREWFDHRYRFRPGDHGPAHVAGDVLAVTGACMYLRRGLLEQVGVMDEAYPMAYEDVDLCLRAWQAGWRVRYCPAAELVHLESTTRGTEVKERERRSQEHFWERWGAFLDTRAVRTPGGGLRVVYVTQETGVGGGHRDIFEHLNGLHDRGHDVALYTLDPPPDWFALRVPVHTFGDYEELVAALEPLEAIKVATWWETGPHVWRASIRRGIPVFYVQDVETSYYPDDRRRREEVLDGYRPEFHYATISRWNQERLAELGLEATLLAPGIDLDTFRPLDVARAETDLLAVGRSAAIKNFALTKAAWRAIAEPRPELVLFGVEPELADTPGMRYVEAPSDAGVAELMARCTAFVQTSAHEGFCLPALEAMATGAAVVCSDMHGNRDFCVDGENCLFVEATVDAVRAGLVRVLGDPALRERLGRAGVETARRYAWPVRIAELEAFLQDVARSRAVTLGSGSGPEIHKAAR
jgi:GT2 family glycosyltransferase/glycosyltransferase involved in cell wall biosynthesis